jgi:hypothetical protein
MVMNNVNRPVNLGAATALIVAQLAPLPALAPIGLSDAAAQTYNRAVTIPCYSTANRTQTCSLPANTMSVSFTGPDRSGLCREGQTWRRTGNAIQVSNGCGGNFEALVRNGGGSGGGWGGGSGGSGGGWGGGSGQGFAGEITCRSRDGREQICYANTDGRVEMLQQYSSSACVEGRSWRADRRSITVRAGCQARFGYGYGNNSGGGWGEGGGWGSNQGFAGQMECRSDNNRYRRCSANTENRVELLRQFSSASCVRGRSWGYDRSSVWVDNGCQARFGYGYGNVSGDTSGNGSSGGSDSGAVIGGVALAAGLIALLAAAGKSSNSSSRSAGAPASATVHADLSNFPSDARTPGQACMNEAARQVGATGGTAVRLDSVDGATREGNGWAIRARATATYPDHSQKLAIDCKATGDKVTAFDVR